MEMGGRTLNKLRNRHQGYSYRELELEIERFGGVAIWAHPFYEWVDEHINEIENKVLYGIMSNIVPLGDSGRMYFIRIAMKRKGSFMELINMYTAMEKMFIEGFISVCTYNELFSLGYIGDRLDGESPADDVFKFNGKSDI
jgi:hypothetical protein